MHAGPNAQEGIHASHWPKTHGWDGSKHLRFKDRIIQ